MKQHALAKENRDCPFCGGKGTLQYYKESTFNNDYYFCSLEECHKIVLWNGVKVEKLLFAGEAYPNRNK
jgi:hypothetical protein